MNEKTLRVLLGLGFFLLPFQGIAGDPDYLYEQLKYMDRDFRQIGTVCEEAARIQLSEQYPISDFSIIVGLVYHNNQRIIGELDIVVISKDNYRAVLIGEVKCRKKLRSAQNLAISQLERFESYISSGKEIDFFVAGNNYEELEIGPWVFQSPYEHITISQDGGENYGFDIALPYSLNDVNDVHEWLLDCHDRGECPAEQP